MTEDFLSAYPAFREPLERGDRIIGETWFAVWENARAFENSGCRSKLLHLVKTSIEGRWLVVKPTRKGK